MGESPLVEHEVLVPLAQSGTSFAAGRLQSPRLPSEHLLQMFLEFAGQTFASKRVEIVTECTLVDDDAALVPKVLLDSVPSLVHVFHHLLPCGVGGDSTSPT